MRIRVRYRNGQLQVVEQEFQSEIYPLNEAEEFFIPNWANMGTDPIRSMIRGRYDLTAQRSYQKK